MAVKNNNGHAVTDVLPPQSDQVQASPVQMPTGEQPGNISPYGPQGHLTKRQAPKGPKT